MKTLAGIRTSLVRALEIVVIVIMGALVLDVMWQVFSRMASGIPQNIIDIEPSKWTDELAVMLLIWVSLLGASVALVKNAHLGVDYFVAKMPEKVREITGLVVYLMTAVFGALGMIYGGIIFVAENTQQFSPALNLPMSTVYVAVPISGFFFLLVSLESFIERLVILRKGTDISGENGC